MGKQRSGQVLRQAARAPGEDFKRGGRPHIKFTLLTHPLDVDNLLEVSAAAQGPAWPGIKALEGQCGFFPVVPGGLWAANRNEQFELFIFPLL